MFYTFINSCIYQKLVLLCGLLLYFSVFIVHATALSFVDNGVTVKTVEIEDLIHIIEVKSLTVNSPTDSSIKSYQGLSLNLLLDAVYTSAWKNNDAVKFTALDGYQSIIPASVIFKHNGMIAIGENGQHGFTKLLRSNSDTVDPAPFFLVWENIRDISARKEPWLSWPWQLKSIELTSFKREYPNSTPPSSSSKSVKKGFLAFRQHCIKCHTLNGDGGSIGPELNYPVSVTEYWKSKWLRRFIVNPQSVRSNSKMIPFYRDVENRQEQVADIIEYLKVMARNKSLTSIQ